jgi:hypothetical protein
MRKGIIFLVTLVITMILISGHALAVTHYAYTIEAYENVVNRNDILGSEDEDLATLGETILGRDFLGMIWLSFNTAAGFTVGDTVKVYVEDNWGREEEYKICFIVNRPPAAEYPSPWQEDISDQSDWEYELEETDEPPTGMVYHYVKIIAEDGSTGGGDDPLFGPEIDAVSFTVI